MIQRLDEMCPRVGALWRSCRFEPRYDTYEPSQALEDQMRRAWTVSDIDKERLQRQKIYVQDVCSVCGRVIQRYDD
jgi:hypothetical protein